MPIVDMPLDKLQSYMGCNPRPDDFDAYWDAALAEMKNIDPEVEMVPCPTRSRTVEYFDLYFTGIDLAK